MIVRRPPVRPPNKAPIINRLRVSNAFNLSGISLIESSRAFNLTGFSILLQSPTPNNVPMLISASASQTITGTARISIVTTVTQPGVSRIAVDTHTNQPGISRITAITTQTQAGTARVYKVATQDITGLSRLSNVVDHTQPGLSRIAKVVDATQPGVSRISIVSSQTQTGVSRLAVLTVRTQLGTTRVYKTTTSTITGISRIEFPINVATQSTYSGLLFRDETGLERGKFISEGIRIKALTAFMSQVNDTSRDLHISRVNTSDTVVFGPKETSAITNGATLQVAASSETLFLLVINYTTNDYGIFMCNSSSVTKILGSTAMVSGVPTGGELGVRTTGGYHIIDNNMGSTQSVWRVALGY